MLTKEQKDKVREFVKRHDFSRPGDKEYVNVQCELRLYSSVAVYGSTVEQVKELTVEELNHFCFLTDQDPYSQLNDGGISLKHTDWDEFLDHMVEE